MQIDKFQKRWIVIGLIALLYSAAVDFLGLGYLLGDGRYASTAVLVIVVILADYTRVKRRRDNPNA